MTPLTVAELRDLLADYPPSAWVLPSLTDDVVLMCANAVEEFGPPDCWDVPLDYDLTLGAELAAEGSAAGLVLLLPVKVRPL